MGKHEIHISTIGTSKRKTETFIVCLVYVRMMVTLCLLAFLHSSLYSLDQCYKNRTEPAGSTGSTGNRTMNRYGSINLPEMYVNRVEPGEPAGFLKNQ